MKEIVLFKDKKDCCACGACLNICPKQAINMHEDDDGFLYPVIDENKCIECGLCMKTCGYQNSKLKQSPQYAYAAQSLNTDIKKSASGGVFASIAKQIIEAGGVVVGTSLEYSNEILDPHYILVENLTDLEKLLGSKYVQSSTGNIYKVTKAYLEIGVMVLFSGTPCQVDGLKSYLAKVYDNLFLIDIICHGVPSKRLFQDYIRFLEEKYNDKIIDFKFRDKTKGWGLTAKAYTANSGEKLIPCYMSSYYDMFLKSYTYRINCYSCKYANKNRVGDITIGDYWGIEVEHPEILVSNGGEINEKQGISCLIVNNERGKVLLEKFGSALSLRQSSFINVAKHNGQLNKPSELDVRKRYMVFLELKKKGYVGIEQWHKIELGYFVLLKNVFKSILPGPLKIFLKKFVGWLMNCGKVS